MDATLNEDSNSLPRLPDSTMGSSVSTEMEHECYELIQSALILPLVESQETDEIKTQVKNEEFFENKFKEDDLIDFSDTKLKLDEIKMNMSFSSPSETCSSTNQDSLHQYFNNFQHDYSNDANPRKNSPIPASPPTNIEIENESLEHLSSLNNHEHTSAFKRVGTKKEKGDKISTCLDKWYRELKGQVLSEFEKTKIQIFQEQQKKLVEEKEKQSLEITRLRKEVDLLRETIKVNEKNLLKKDDVIENLTKALEKQREKNELQRVMMEWKFKRVENAKETFTTKLADKYYTQRLKLKTFFSWQIFLIHKHKAKVEKACKKKAEEVCYDLATNYESKVKKLEEELNSSKNEIEKYKIEMSKHEENMRKALMRGVCALNMEAMSIFNENASNQIESHQQTENYTKPSSSLNDLNRKHSESKELARKVKTYCETSLSRKTQDTTNISAVAKAKLQLLSTGLKNSSEEQVVEKFNQESQKFCSNNKLFDELTEHNIMLKKKPSNKMTNVRAKIGSLPQTSKALVPQLSSNMPPYRSVVIEKHTNHDDLTIKTTTSKVKYTPPGQPATVLNTVITS